VNLARGTGNWRDPIRVVADAAGGAPSVAVGDYQSEADEDDRARDREETKRLLYVALTRARDRLYLGSVLKEGRIQPTRGSLAEVLPASLIDAMNAAAIAGEPVRWRSHVLTFVGGADLVRSAHAAGLTRPALHDCQHGPDEVGATSATDVDFEPVEDGSVRRVSAGSVIDHAATMPAVAGAGRESHRVLGTLVHRLVRRFGLAPAADIDAAVPGLLNAREAVDIPESEAVCRDAANAYRALCSMSDVRDLYHAGAPLHEVPFTMALDGQIVRGTIDCLVVADGAISVLEFKTGRARPEHAIQVELYGKAVQALYPGRRVDLRVIYLGEAAI
jgi:ATP-dependent helicase/nuclease subunit A